MTCKGKWKAVTRRQWLKNTVIHKFKGLVNSRYNSQNMAKASQYFGHVVRVDQSQGRYHKMVDMHCQTAPVLRVRVVGLQWRGNRLSLAYSGHVHEHRPTVVVRGGGSWRHQTVCCVKGRGGASASLRLPSFSSPEGQAGACTSQVGSGLFLHQHSWGLLLTIPPIALNYIH